MHRRETTSALITCAILTGGSLAAQTTATSPVMPVNPGAVRAAMIEAYPPMLLDAGIGGVIEARVRVLGDGSIDQFDAILAGGVPDLVEMVRQVSAVARFPAAHPPRWGTWIVTVSPDSLRPRGAERQICPTPAAFASVLRQAHARSSRPPSSIDGQPRPRTVVLQVDRSIDEAPHCEANLAAALEGPLEVKPVWDYAQPPFICLAGDCKYRDPVLLFTVKVKSPEMTWLAGWWSIGVKVGPQWEGLFETRCHASECVITRSNTPIG